MILKRVWGKVLDLIKKRWLWILACLAILAAGVWLGYRLASRMGRDVPAQDGTRTIEEYEERQQDRRKRLEEILK
ncbi:MAG: hypothetical protein NUW23_00575 [Firmicutes bacterium]|jgi:hypothetical protein|nr:hypothetical protein [Bacillota bacterium]